MYVVYFSVQFLYYVPINKVQNCCIRCLSENYLQHGGPQRFDCKTEFRVIYKLWSRDSDIFLSLGTLITHARILIINLSILNSIKHYFVFIN